MTNYNPDNCIYKFEQLRLDYHDLQIPDYLVGCGDCSGTEREGRLCFRTLSKLIEAIEGNLIDLK